MKSGRRAVLRLVGGAAAIMIATAACGSSGSSSGGDTNAGAPASAAPTSPAPTGSALVIGTVGEYSGFSSATSKATADAVEAWAKWTNDHGGINGHPVKVIVKDDSHDPAKSIAAVKGMIENDKVVALVGLHESGLEAAWTDYVSGKKVPVIGGSATSPLWMTNPNFFPASTATPNYTPVEANSVKLAGEKKFGTIVCAEVPACAQAIPLLQTAAQRVGIEFTGGIAVAASAPNYTTQCLKLRSDGAESVILNTAQEVATRFASDCAKQGYKPTFVTSGMSYSDKLAGNSAFDGSYVANDSFNWFGSDPVSKDFQAAMKQYKPSTPLNTSATAGWAAAVMFGKAAAKVSATPTSAEIYTGLYAQPANNTLGGLIPPTTYTEGKPATAQTCGWYTKIAGGKPTAPHGDKAICLK